MSDTTAPTLSSIRLSTSSLNVGAGQTTLLVTARFTDNLSGIFDGVFADGSGGSPPQIRFISPSGQTVTGLFDILHPVSGDRLDGLYQAQITLGSTAEAGLWEVQYLLLNDEAGNTVSLTPGTSTAVAAATFSATNSGSEHDGTTDTTPPKVISFTASDPLLTSANTVHYTLTFSEMVVGLDADEFNLVSAGVGGAGIAGVMAVEGSNGQQYTITLNTGVGDGTIALNFLGTGIQDLAGNSLLGDPFENNPVNAPGSGAYSIAIDDVNGDDKPDLVTTDYTAAPKV